MKEKYVCTDDLIIDGVLMCQSGKIYEIVDAVPTPGMEAYEDVNGYCDILGCENGGVCMATWLDVAEHFNIDQKAKSC